MSMNIDTVKNDGGNGGYGPGYGPIGNGHKRHSETIATLFNEDSLVSLEEEVEVSSSLLNVFDILTMSQKKWLMSLFSFTTKVFKFTFFKAVPFVLKPIQQMGKLIFKTFKKFALATQKVKNFFQKTITTTFSKVLKVFHTIGDFLGERVINKAKMLFKRVNKILFIPIKSILSKKVEVFFKVLTKSFTFIFNKAMRFVSFSKKIFNEKILEKLRKFSEVLTKHLSKAKVFFEDKKRKAIEVLSKIQQTLVDLSVQIAFSLYQLTAPVMKKYVFSFNRALKKVVKAYNRMQEKAMRFLKKAYGIIGGVIDRALTFFNKQKDKVVLILKRLLAYFMLFVNRLLHLLRIVFYKLVKLLIFSTNLFKKILFSFFRIVKSYLLRAKPSLAKK